MSTSEKNTIPLSIIDACLTGGSFRTSRFFAFPTVSDYNFRALLAFQYLAGFMAFDFMAFAAARSNSALETSNRYRPVGFFLHARMYAAPFTVLMS